MLTSRVRTRIRMLLPALLATILAACAPAATPAPTSPSAPPPTAAPAAKPGEAARPAEPPAKPAEVTKPAEPASKVGPAVTRLPDFPSKAIEIIVPYPPGGGFDAVARQLATPLTNLLGQPVVVKNVPGGNQRIAARQFEQAPSDGHTIMFVGDTGVYVSTLVEPAEGFDMTAWQWVAGVRQLNPYIGVGKDSPFTSIKDLMDADQAGQRLRMGNNGIGGFLPNNAVFAELIGLQHIVHVGGFGGTGDLVPALVRGDLDLHLFQPISSTVQFVNSGDIHPLLVVKPARDPLLPEVPTPRELGLPNVAELEAMGGQTIGFSVVKNTSPERIKVLEQATLAALKDPDFLKWAKESGVEQDIIGVPGAEMVPRKQAEYALFNKNADVLRRIVQS